MVDDLTVTDDEREADLLEYRMGILEEAIDRLTPPEIISSMATGRSYTFQLMLFVLILGLCVSTKMLTEPMTEFWMFVRMS